MDDKKIGGMIGLAVKARQAQLGAGRALDCLRAGKAGLLLLDEAASDNTRKRFTDACASHEVELLMLPPGLLGQAAGKTDTMVAALLKGSMADRLRGMGRSDIMDNE